MSKIVNIDCMEYMSQFEDKYFDLGVLDPPFGLSDTKKNRFRSVRETHSYKNNSIPTENYFKEVNRVCKATIIFGCQYMMPYLDPKGSFIVWDKMGDPDKNNMSAADIAWYSKRERIRVFRFMWSGIFKGESEPIIHIHQKPVTLYRWIFKHYAKRDFRILDTHLGSGSSRIAADQVKMNLDFHGTEIDPKIFSDQEKRFNAYKSKLEIPYEQTGNLSTK